ncbi:MAG: cytochrome-c peroxidase [Candidatus Promineifilaceae bacterium]
MKWQSVFTLGLFYLLFVALLGGCAAPDPIALEGPVSCIPANFEAGQAGSKWNSAEIASICSLWIGNLPDLPPDPTNLYADNEAAATFGQRLFFDTQFSADGDISCGTCHKAEHNFTDGRSTPIGNGPRKTQTIVGTAYSPWMFWDGHKDSQWAQALEPWESPVEHKGNRNDFAAIIATDDAYRAEYESIFGALPDHTSADGATEIFVNMGKAVAAYERLIMPGPANFDAYAQALLANDEPTLSRVFNEDEVAGLGVFINQGECLNCHNDPLFTNNAFHNTAVFGFVDEGRLIGAQSVLDDEFNCRSEWSDDSSSCAELDFIRTSGIELKGAFRTPTLRNVAEGAPYTHTGGFADLASILEHYNQGGVGLVIGNFGHNELNALNLSAEQLGQLEAFLRTLSGGYSADEKWLAAP